MVYREIGVEVSALNFLRAEVDRLRAENERLRIGIKDALDLLSDGPGGPRRLSAMKLLNKLVA
jgi:hypothetical protein